MTADTGMVSEGWARGETHPLGFAISRQMALRSPGLGPSWARSSQDPQVVRDDPEPDPALHACASAIATAVESMTALEHADPSLAAGAPAERAPKPSQRRRAPAAQQSDIADAARGRRALVALRSEAGIGDGQPGRVAEERDMAGHRWDPPRAGRHPPDADLVVRDELGLGLLNLHDLAELGWLGCFAFADGFRVRLEQTEDFARVMRVAFQHARARLREDAAHEADGRAQVLPHPRQRPRRPTIHRGPDGLGVADHRARDLHQLPIEPGHPGLAACAHGRFGSPGS